MLAVNRVSKTYADHVVLRDVSFTLNAGERLGLVGPNGAGKTTLLRILLGREQPDAGVVQFASGLRVGYLAQGFEAAPGTTLQDILTASQGDLAGAEAEVERTATGLAGTPEDPAAQAAYEAALTRLEAAGTQADSGRAAATLAALGLAALPGDTPVETLSGGQKTRLALALVLLSDPQVLLLDEPTNHLDMEMLVWLEAWLARFRGAALVVSHDRTFLDHTVAGILELDEETHGVRAYPGNYSAYVEAKLEEHGRRWDAWRDQQAEVRRMRQDIARTKEHALSVERGTTPRTPGPRRYAKKVARKALAREKKLDRYLASDERVDKPKTGWQMKLEFEDTPASSRDVLVLEELAVGYAIPARQATGRGEQATGNGQQAADVRRSPLLSGINLTLRYGERVALTGANGAGKTTLARTIAGRLPPLAGRARLGTSVRMGYYAQEQELLRPDLDALGTLQQYSGQPETELRNFLHYFLFEGDEVFTPVAELSFGERARLVLAVLVAQGCNFLLLDEPVNHLDIPSRARFESALSNFDGTVLAIVHDRYFIEHFATAVWSVEDGTVREKPIGV